MDNNQFKCPACGTNFNSQQELHDHAAQAHQAGASESQPAQNASLTCPVCGFNAHTPEELEQHKQQSMSDPKHQMPGTGGGSA